MNDNRVGNYMILSTGRKFWPLDPREAEVDIEAIAHHLGMACRWGGAVQRFYSVAEHSVHCSRLVPPEHALEALLHDAAEAYLGDLIRPLKHDSRFAAYLAVEAPIERVIARRFNVEYPWPASVKRADEAMGATEAAQLIRHDGEWTGVRYAAQAAVTLRCWEPAGASIEFLLRFHNLMAERENAA